MSKTDDLATQAYKLFYAGKYMNALSIYYQVLALDLNNSVNYYNVALTYEMLGEFELSVSYYK